MSGYKITFEVELSSLEEPAQIDVDRLAFFTAQALNRSMGADRFKLFYEKRLYLFKPEDADRGPIRGREMWQEPGEIVVSDSSEQPLASAQDNGTQP